MHSLTICNLFQLYSLDFCSFFVCLLESYFKDSFLISDIIAQIHPLVSLFQDAWHCSSKNNWINILLLHWYLRKRKEREREWVREHTSHAMHCTMLTLHWTFRMCIRYVPFRCVCAWCNMLLFTFEWHLPAADAAARRAPTIEFQDNECPQKCI